MECLEVTTPMVDPCREAIIYGQRLFIHWCFEAKPMLMLLVRNKLSYLVLRIDTWKRTSKSKKNKDLKFKVLSLCASKSPKEMRSVIEFIKANYQFVKPSGIFSQLFGLLGSYSIMLMMNQHPPLGVYFEKVKEVGELYLFLLKMIYTWLIMLEVGCWNHGKCLSRFDDIVWELNIWIYPASWILKMMFGYYYD